MSDELGRLTSAGRTQRGGRVEIETAGFDLLFTPQADTVCAALKPLQRRIDADDFGCSPFFGRARHGLDLDGVHTRETADTLLIEGHRFATVGGLLTEFGQLVPQSAEASPDVAIAGHITTKPSQTGARGRSPGGHRP